MCIELRLNHSISSYYYKSFGKFTDSTTAATAGVVPVARFSSTNFSYPSSTHASPDASSRNDHASKSTSNANDSTSNV